MRGFSTWGRVIGLALLAAATLSIGGRSNAQSLPTIRVGWTVPAEEAKWLIMKRPELFAGINKKYKIEWSQFQGTPPISTALLANAVDCGTQAPISFGKAASEGDYKGYILGAMAAEQPGSFSVFWAVKEDSPIKTAADLKGKTIASTAFGGGIYYFMRTWLQQRGVDPDKDVKLVEVSFPQVEEAIRTGRVDAGPFAQPFAARMWEKGGIRKLFEIIEVQSPLVDIFEVCSKAYTDANPAVVKAYMEDFKAAVKHAIAHPEDARKVTSEILKIDVAVLSKYLMTKDDFYRDPNGTPDFASIQKTWDSYIETGVMKKPIKVTDYQRLDLTPKAD